MAAACARRPFEEKLKDVALLTSLDLLEMHRAESGAVAAKLPSALLERHRKLLDAAKRAQSAAMGSATMFAMKLKARAIQRRQREAATATLHREIGECGAAVEQLIASGASPTLEDELVDLTNAIARAKAVRVVAMA